MTVYDVIIVGAGMGGLFSAYELIQNNPSLKIKIIEKGKKLNERKCFVSNTQQCIRCNPCSIMSGEVGAGGFSDFKTILSPSYGGWLQDYIGWDQTQVLINQFNEILEKFGDQTEIKYPDDELQQRCLRHNLRLISSPLKHIGTDHGRIIMKNMIDFLLDKGVEIDTEMDVKSIINVQENLFKVQTNKTDEECRKVIFAVGRVGNKFIEDYCNRNGIKVYSNHVDLGVRVELPSVIWKEFEDKIYEPKIQYRTKTYEDTTRMFCHNSRGYVVTENTNGILTTNGHAYKEEKLKTNNSNFAILSSIHFTEPFNNPIEYVSSIAKLSNIIGNGNVLIQRFGDLIRGRRSTESRIAMSTTIPTLKATPGDLSLVLPKRILDNIIETIYALNQVAPGTSNDDSLLYGVEAKYYSIRPQTNDNFEISKNVYCIGDGSGITRSLSQAGAMGIYVAKKILGNAER